MPTSSALHTLFNTYQLHLNCPHPNFFSKLSCSLLHKYHSLHQSAASVTLSSDSQHRLFTTTINKQQARSTVAPSSFATTSGQVQRISQLSLALSLFVDNSSYSANLSSLCPSLLPPQSTFRSFLPGRRPFDSSFPSSFPKIKTYRFHFPHFDSLPLPTFLLLFPAYIAGSAASRRFYGIILSSLTRLHHLRQHHITASSSISHLHPRPTAILPVTSRSALLAPRIYDRLALLFCYLRFRLCSTQLGLLLDRFALLQSIISAYAFSASNFTPQGLKDHQVHLHRLRRPSLLSAFVGPPFAFVHFL